MSLMENADITVPHVLRYCQWDDSEDLNNWAFAATECGNSILDVNPNALILIEGVEQYPKRKRAILMILRIFGKLPLMFHWYGAWWGGNLRRR